MSTQSLPPVASPVKDTEAEQTPMAAEKTAGRGKRAAGKKPLAAATPADVDATPPKAKKQRGKGTEEASGKEKPEKPDAKPKRGAKAKAAAGSADEERPQRQKSQKKIGLYEEFKADGKIPEPPVSRLSAPAAAAATFKAVAWNVGGLRGFLKSKSELLVKLANVEKPDLIGIMETKLQEGEQVQAVQKQLAELLPEYQETTFYCSKEKKGYSGVAVLLRKPAVAVRPVKLETGGDEGRVLEVEFPEHTVVLSYVPNSGDKLQRLEERTKAWDVALRQRLLRSARPVLLLGDLNVAHRDVDIWNSEAPHVPKSAGTTQEERDSFSELLGSGFVDSFAHRHPDARGQFSYWSVRAGNRPKNRGLRLDYALVPRSVAERKHDEKSLSEGVALVDGFHLPELCPGGDHCPVGALLTLPKPLA